ncbi:protein wntless [Chrysoperla carnea]|uniref:protein wntless n=1 Tax=Chrysoperla carnea TaxID=189513 RepID=UPI001D085FBA|nr:protein wntless [Chrysoperla carnea]
MPGTILENLSGRKLGILVSILLIIQIICFFIGGLLAPPPSGHHSILATKCLDETGDINYTNRWYYNRGVGSCEGIHSFTADGKPIRSDDISLANKIVFVFQMPLPRNNMELDYSRWHQTLIGVLNVDISSDNSMDFDEPVPITIHAQLGYRNKGDPDNAWKFYAGSVEQRIIDCQIDKADKHNYNCSMIPLFELGSVHHDFYLLNLRLPIDTEMNMNNHLGHIEDVHLTVIHQNGGFTMVWMAFKTIFFPFIVGVMIWFWHRVTLLSRSPALLEYMLLYLGSTLTLLNLPLEYLTLFWDLPCMLLLGDIRQGIFYAMLLSFWLVFAGEHMLIQDNTERNSLKPYWKHLSAVAIGCLSLFIFDMCERGIQLINPFYSIWVTEIGTHLALSFIILAALSACMYFVFLCYMVWKVFCNISVKRSSLPSMSKARRLHYEGIIYRFKFLMLSTLLCAALTIIGFILGQVSEGEWKWDEHGIEYSSGFFTGVYAMWNVYIFALIVLYSPSHKKWPSESLTGDKSISEEIEFSRLPTDPSQSEISSLTSFARKAAVE